MKNLRLVELFICDFSCSKETTLLRTILLISPNVANAVVSAKTYTIKEKYSLEFFFQLKVIECFGFQDI